LQTVIRAYVDFQANWRRLPRRRLKGQLIHCASSTASC